MSEDVSEEDLDEYGGLHRHCSSCYSFILCTRDGDCCEFACCPDDCGAVFHTCKGPEHLMLCGNVRVDCLNVESGCEAKLLRRQLAAHLEKCPASVVVCTAEWNRWPVFSSERQKFVCFRQRNPYAQEGQLDYDLAMRDQRMLNNLGKISRKTRLSLRNNLTRRFPAVPLPNSVFHLDEENEQVPDPRENLENIEYVKMDDRLSRQMQRWQEDLDERLKDKAKVPKYWEHPELEKGNVHSHCAHCFRSDCEHDHGDANACKVVRCRWKCGRLLHGCKQFEHGMICPMFEEADDFAWMFRGVGGEQNNRSMNKKREKEKPLKPAESLFVGPGEPAFKCKKSTIPIPPPMPRSVQERCRLDIRLETVTRLQTKPRSMYTFVCAQEFRRDEFAWHAKNVHDEVHGGLNNWVEQRCPMANYGCPFAARRMFPHDHGHTLVYGRLTESFGVTTVEGKSKLPLSRKKSTSKRTFLNLPTEILLKIFSSLDSFTLCNLAVTTKYLRSLCCALLDRKGCVTLQWERLRVDNEYRWGVAYKRWFFSTALAPIEKWAFGTDGSVANHMKKCPYNVKQEVKAVRKSKEWNAVLTSLKETYGVKRSSR